MTRNGASRLYDFLLVVCSNNVSILHQWKRMIGA